MRTETLRAVGGFDVEAEHFDDWAAWLRIADRGTAIRPVPDAVAEWRIHRLGLSGKLLHAGAMKRRLLALFEHLQSCLSQPNAHAVAMARRIVASSEITTYDDYVDAIAMARESLHDVGRASARPSAGEAG